MYPKNLYLLIQYNKLINIHKRYIYIYTSKSDVLMVVDRSFLQRSFIVVFVQVAIDKL